MTSERSDNLFEVLEPPRDGLAGLRARLERERRRQRRRLLWVPAVGAATMALMLAVALWPSATVTSPEPIPALELARVRYGQAPSPDEIVSIPTHERSRAAALQVFESERVAFYLIDSK